MSIERFTSKDGTKIACFRSGSGTPLVLVHGTTADHSRWTPVLPALEARFTVYACDRRGRGESGDVQPYALEREFEDVAAIVDGIGGPVDVLAHSHGALVSIEGAALAKNLRRLALYEPPIPAGIPIYPPGSIDKLQALLDAGDREGVVKTFLAEIARILPNELAVMQSKPAWQARVAAAHTIVRELRGQLPYTFDAARVRSVRVPTLLLLGGSSPPFFKAAIDLVHDALPQSRVVVLPGQTHVAIDTATDQFAREVIAFLE
jgi:pimeloyl-ACP methyl ester carboxylesterase